MMSKKTHNLFIVSMVIILLCSITVLTWRGLSYYQTAKEERFYHADNNLLKPSGVFGHGYGIAGSLLIVTGVSSYMARKRFKALSRISNLKTWLEVHIFLCTLGPVLILFHTAFKFGGIVSVSFWSMVAVFLSGIAGRFIYLQIPRSIEGQELSLSEIRDSKTDVVSMLRENYHLNEDDCSIITASISRSVTFDEGGLSGYIKDNTQDRMSIKTVRRLLRSRNLPGSEIRNIIRLVSDDIKMSRKIKRLSSMQNMFKYWHVIHSPFALVMLIIMIIHVAVTIAFGYRWIF